MLEIPSAAEFFSWSPSDQDAYHDRFDDEYGRLVRKVVEVNLFELWNQTDLVERVLNHFTTWTPVEFGRYFHCNRATLGRWRNGKCVPSPTLAHRCLRMFFDHYPEIAYDLVYDAVAIAAAVQRAICEREAWELQQWTLRSSRLSKQRCSLQETTIDDAVLAFALASPGPVFEIWRSVVRGLGDDWCDSVEIPEFSTFLADLLEHVSCIFGESAKKERFAKAAAVFADLDLNQPKDVQWLVRKMQSVWEATAVATHCIARCLQQDC
ncbi:MAG: hypothetical protein SFV23_16860 [Planctomycetaceae bacterium]|nr:hypothetical protein [Planctomycetaceae bacterium]